MRGISRAKHRKTQQGASFIHIYAKAFDKFKGDTGFHVYVRLVKAYMELTIGYLLQYHSLTSATSVTISKISPITFLSIMHHLDSVYTKVHVLYFRKN